MTEISYLSRASAVAYLADRGIVTTHGTLTKYASAGGGPEYRMFGRRAYYTQASLDAWVAARMSPIMKSTADASKAGV